MADVELSKISCGPVILVVDDIPGARTIVRSMLEDMGIGEIIEAADGAEAYEAARANPVALVISDYNMSPKTGIDLLRDLRGSESTSRIPFIMVTAIDEHDLSSEAKALGAVSYLIKPVRFKTLQEQVVAALRAQMV